MSQVLEKVDLRKAMRPYWCPPVGRFVIIEIPSFRFLMVDGRGNPNTSVAYQSAVQWLYTMSYALKFMSKADGRDYGVAPLEGLWWSDDPDAFTAGAKDSWLWTAMIMQPDWISDRMVAMALPKAGAKLGTTPESLRFEGFAEGLSVQTTFVGPYASEEADDREAARRVPARQQSQGKRQASRNLPQRSAPRGTGKA